MVFIRMKKIKQNQYAYLVENLYRRRGNPVKQKTRMYLGRVLIPAKTMNNHFLEWLNRESPKRYMDKSSFAQIINDLARWEMARHGIEKEAKQVLKINHGFLCEYTLQGIHKVMRKIRQESLPNKEMYEREYAVELAESFVKAGIEIPESVFIALFKKLIGEKDVS